LSEKNTVGPGISKVATLLIGK